jgi:hypothetical protein
MAQAYVPIQTVTVGSGGAASIEFTNIPQNYTDLSILLTYRTTVSGPTDGKISFNSSTSNFSWRSVYGTGSAAVSGNNTVNNALGQVQGSAATALTFASLSIYIPNYAGGNNKSFSVDYATENNATLAYGGLVAGLWSQTSAITSIGISLDSGNLAEYSTATLYGIGGTRASGGTVTADGRYTYHTFTSTGTFTANEKIKGAEVLLIAGGGGSGADRGGGGGAGGLLTSAGQQLTAGTSYSVIVGAGGAGGTGVSEGSSSNTRGSNGSNSQFGVLNASGGGGGGACSTGSNLNGQNGGSGGGAGFSTGSSGTVGTGTSGQGNNGGTGIDSGGADGGGGGGGASAVGANATSSPKTGGNGGAGSSTYSSWGYATSTGQLSGGIYYYAGGGGGGGDSRLSTFAGSGGLGGGGAGNNSGGGTAGTANTGGGGGGGNVSSSGTSGGSGLVIIRYPN